MYKKKKTKETTVYTFAIGLNHYLEMEEKIGNFKVLFIL